MVVVVVAVVVVALVIAVVVVAIVCCLLSLYDDNCDHHQPVVWPHLRVDSCLYPISLIPPALNLLMR